MRTAVVSSTVPRIEDGVSIGAKTTSNARVVATVTIVRDEMVRPSGMRTDPESRESPMHSPHATSNSAIGCTIARTRSPKAPVSDPARSVVSIGECTTTLTRPG